MSRASIRVRLFLSAIALAGLTCAQLACREERQPSPDRDAIVALDESLPVADRQAAVAKMKREGQLRSLESLIPGHLDAITLEAVWALGDVGDARSADHMESLRRGTASIPGKLNAAIHESAAKIRERTR